MKTWLDEIMEANAEYMKRPDATRFTNTILPGDRAVITCMDPRCRIEAIGADRPSSEGKVTRIVYNAGGKPDFRSLFILLYLANMKEFVFMAHTDCGLTKSEADPDRLINRMKERLGDEGFARARALIGEPLRERLRYWLQTFSDPYEEARQRVRSFKNHPLVPKDVVVHGLVQDIFTGKVEVVVNGYEERGGED